MDQQLVNQLFEVVLIPLLGVLVAFFVKWVNVKSAEIAVSTDNTLMTKYLSMLTSTITDCVIATNQTYVDALKAEGKFDAEAQKKAFSLTCDAVLAILTDDAKEYFSESLGYLESYITSKIESQVKLQKTIQPVTPPTAIPATTTPTA